MKEESFAPAFWYPMTRPLDNAWAGCTTIEKKRKSPPWGAAKSTGGLQFQDFFYNLSR
jgi:hypothetical protein